MKSTGIHYAWSIICRNITIRGLLSHRGISLFITITITIMCFRLPHRAYLIFRSSPIVRDGTTKMKRTLSVIMMPQKVMKRSLHIVLIHFGVILVTSSSSCIWFECCISFICDCAEDFSRVISCLNHKKFSSLSRKFHITSRTLQPTVLSSWTLGNSFCTMQN